MPLQADDGSVVSWQVQHLAPNINTICVLKIALARVHVVWMFLIIRILHMPRHTLFQAQRVGVCRGHSSYVRRVDWSADSRCLRSCDGTAAAAAAAAVAAATKFYP